MQEAAPVEVLAVEAGEEKQNAASKAALEEDTNKTQEAVAAAEQAGEDKQTADTEAAAILAEQADEDNQNAPTDANTDKTQEAVAPAAKRRKLEEAELEVQAGSLVVYKAVESNALAVALSSGSPCGAGR